MRVHSRHRQLLLSNNNKAEEQGFILALVVIVGLILAAGAMALIARSTSGMLGSIRQQQSREAREIAENGTGRVVERLNREYAYLLINCYDRDVNTVDWSNCKSKAAIGTWDAPKYGTATCPGSNLSSANMIVDGSVNTAAGSRAGRWQLEFYHFSGSKLYGGQGVMRVRGQRLSADGSVLAEAYVDQELSIKPKNCDAAFNQPPTSTGFPGLIGRRISLGNNDVLVLGQASANVLCVGCENINEVTQGPNSEPVKIFASNISLPDVPRVPAGLTPITKPGTYSSGSINDGSCLVESSKTPPVTHCRLGNIDLSGSNASINFDTSKGPMQLYLQCDPINNTPCSGPNISLSGAAGICSTTTIDPTELALFGNHARETTSCSQTVSLSGGSNATVMFAYLPDACGGINGGSSNPDLVGALWLKSFGPIGSSSNRAELLVPDDMGARVFTRFGNSFALSIRDFVAIGINNWASFQMPPPASGMFR
jgi:hypothetical protein